MSSKQHTEDFALTATFSYLHRVWKKKSTIFSTYLWQTQTYFRNFWQESSWIFTWL